MQINHLLFFSRAYFLHIYIPILQYTDLHLHSHSSRVNGDRGASHSCAVLPALIDPPVSWACLTAVGAMHKVAEGDASGATISGWHTCDLMVTLAIVDCELAAMSQ
jgi:hypothetical protein